MKKIGMMLIGVLCTALSLAALELPKDGSYEEMKKIVPSDAVFVFYEDAGAINNGGWVKAIKAMPEAAELLGANSEDPTGSLIVFGGGFSTGIPKIVGMIYCKTDNGLDDVAKAFEANKSGIMPFKLEEIEQDGHRGFMMRIPGSPMDIRFMELAPHWLVLGLGEQGVAEYLKTPQDKLGINPELAALLEPHKDQMIFGALLMPEKLQTKNCEFFGDFSSPNAVINVICAFVNEQEALKAKQSFDQAWPGVIQALDMSIPGISGMLGDGMTCAVQGSNLNFTLILQAEKVGKFAVVFKELAKARAEALKAQAAAAESAAASAVPVESAPAAQPGKETPAFE